MRKWNWIYDDLAWVFDDLPAMSYSHTLNGYDPKKYELKPRKDYIDTLIKEKEREIEYHESKITQLREDKERLEKQKQD